MAGDGRGRRAARRIRQRWLEAACEAGLNAARVRRLGLPDRFVEHGDRGELLADLGLDEAGIYLEAARRGVPASGDDRRLVGRPRAEP